MGDVLGHEFHGNQYTTTGQVVAASERLVARAGQKMKAKEHLEIAGIHRAIAAYHKEQIDKLANKAKAYFNVKDRQDQIGFNARKKYFMLKTTLNAHTAAYRNHISAAHMHELIATKSKEREVPLWHTDTHGELSESTEARDPKRAAEEAHRETVRAYKEEQQKLPRIYKRRKQ